MNGEVPTDPHIALGTEQESKLLTGQLFEREIEEEEIKFEFDPLGPKDLDPFPDQTPVKILDRWRAGNDITMSTTGTLTTINPFLHLFADSVVSDVCKTFVYMRSDIEVMLFFESSPTTYGMIAVAPNPGRCLNNGGVNDVDTTTRLLSHETMIFDVATKTQISFIIPWVSPAPYLPIRDLAVAGCLADGDYQVCDFTIYTSAIHDIANTTTQTLKLTPKFRFHNPKLIGYRSVAEATFNGYETFEAQMPRMGRDRGTAGAVSAAASGVGAVASVATAAYTVYSGGSTTAQEAIKLGGQVIKGKQSKQPKPDPVPSVKQSVWGDLVANTAPAYQLAGLSLADGFGTSFKEILQKPSSVAWEISLSTTASTWSVNPRTAGFSDSADNSTRLSFFSRFFRYWRGSINFAFRFVSSPLMTYRVAINLGVGGIAETATRQEDIVCRSVTVRGTTDVVINVPYLMGNSWSICEPIDDTGLYPKLSVFLSSPPITSLPAATLTLPYYIWSWAGDDFEFAGLRDPNALRQIPDADVFQAQMKVGQFCSMVEPLFSGSCLPPPVDMEEIDMVEDIGKRYCSIPSNFTDINIPVSATVPMPFLLQATRNDALDPISWLATMFVFSRGQLDYKVNVNDALDDQFLTVEATKAVTPNGPHTDERCFDGMVRINAGFGNILEFSTPWMCQFDLVQHSILANLLIHPSINSAFYRTNQWAGHYGVMNTQLQDNNESIVPNATVYKLGRGFSFVYDIPPPNTAFLPPVGVPQPTPVAKTQSVDVAVRRTIPTTIKPVKRSGPDSRNPLLDSRKVKAPVEKRLNLGV